MKKHCFWGYPRLCLFLIFGLGLFGCSVLKQGNGTDTNFKTYRISGDLLPGYDESNLIAALDGTAIVNIDRPLLTNAFKDLSEQFTLSVRVNNEAVLQRILSRLQSSGFRVKNAAVQN